MHPEGIDRGTLPRTWYPRDTDAHGLPCIGEAALNDLLGDGLMVGAVALNECHGLTEAGDVGAEDAFDEFIHRIGTASYAS